MFHFLLLFCEIAVSESAVDSNSQSVYHSLLSGDPANVNHGNNLFQTKMICELLILISSKNKFLLVKCSICKGIGGLISFEMVNKKL